MSTLYPSTKIVLQVMRELGYRHRTSKVQGITQFAEFWTFPIENSSGERESNHVGFYNRTARERFRDEHVKIFESRTAELGCPWYVTIKNDGHMIVSNVKFWSGP